MLAELHLLRPFWLLLLPIVFAAAWLLFKHRGDAGDMRAICDPELLDYVVEPAGSNSKTWALVLIGGSLAVLALCGIAWQKLPAPVFDDGHSVVIVLDASRSMDADDIAPSRLSRAKLKIIDLLKSGKLTQAALLVYAAEPYVVSPLTRDSNTIISLIPSINTEIMPNQGSNTEAALLKALQLIKNAGAVGDILLLSDGVKQSPKAQALAKQMGVKINIIGVGSRQGAPIPSRNGLLQDENGQIVISKLDEQSMLQLSQQAGGNYSELSTDNSDLDHTINLPLSLVKRKIDAAKVDLWREQGSWLVVPIIFMLLIYFRKSAILNILLPVVVLAAFNPQSAHANSIFLNSNQQGAQQFDNKDFAKAAKSFSDQRWRAAAQYRAGDFAGALQTLEPFNDATAQYNKGNALANLGRVDAAIAAYDEALKQQPDFADALYNKNALQAMQKQQQNQQQNQQNNKGDKQQDKPDKNSAGKNNQQKSGGKNQQDKQNSANAKQKQQDKTNRHDDKSAEKDKADNKDKQDKSGKTDKSDKQKTDKNQQDKQSAAPTPRQRELDNAAQQWLRQIPDRPSNLLRNQFANEFQRNGGSKNPEEQQW